MGEKPDSIVHIYKGGGGAGGAGPDEAFWLAHGGRITARDLAHAKRMVRPRGAAHKALDRLAADGLGTWKELTVQGGSRTEIVSRDEIAEKDGNSFIKW